MLERLQRFTPSQTRKGYRGTVSWLISTNLGLQLFQKAFFHFSHIQLILILLTFQLNLLSSPPSDILSILTKFCTRWIYLQGPIEESYEKWVYLAILIFSWTFLLVLNVYLLILGIIGYNEEKKPSLLEKCFHGMFTIHYKALFWIINIILFLPWLDRNTGKEPMKQFQTPLRVVNLVLIIFNYFIAGISAFFSFDPFPGKNNFACHSSSHQFLTVLSKGIMSMSYLFIQKSNQGGQIPILVILLIIESTKLTFLYKKVPFYNYQTLKMAVLWSSVSTWISGVNLVLIIFIKEIRSESLDYLFYFTFLLLPLFVKLALSQLESVMTAYKSIDLKDLNTQSQFLKKILATKLALSKIELNMSSENNFKISELYSLALIRNHSLECQETKCICKMISNNVSTSDMKTLKGFRDSLEEFYQARMIDILKQGIQKQKNNSKLKVILIQNLLSQQQIKIRAAITTLTSNTMGEKLHFTEELIEEITLKRIQREINNYFNTKQNNVLNMKAYVDFSADEKRFLDLAISTTRKYIDFWNYFLGPTPKIMNLLKKSVCLEKEADHFEELWRVYTNKYKNFYNIMSDMYYVYLKLVRNMPFMAHKLNKNSAYKLKLAHELQRNYESGITEDSLYLPGTITLAISMSKERIGRITFASENITTLLGFRRDELLGKNVNMLMFPLLRSKHDEILSKHLSKIEKYEKKDFYYTFTSFISTKKGYVLPCSNYITIFPYVEKELIYINTIRINSSDQEYLVVNQDGVIDAYTQRIGKALNLSTKDIINLKDIISNSDVNSPLLVKEDKRRRKSMPFILHSILDESNGRIVSFIKYKKPTRKEKENCDSIEKELKFEIKLTPQTLQNISYYLMSIKNFDQAYITDFEDFDEREIHKTTQNESSFDIPQERLTSLNEMPTSPNYLLSSPSTKRSNNPFLSARSLKNNVSSIELPYSQALKITQKSNPNLLSSETEQTPRGPNEVNRPETQDFYKNSILKVNIIKCTSEDSHESESERNNPTISIQNNKENDFASNDYTTSSVTEANAKLKLERTIYRIPVSNVSKYMNSLVFIYLLLYVTLLVIFKISETNNLKLLDSNVQILTVASFRLTRLIDIARAADYVFLYWKGIFNESRWNVSGIPIFRNNIVVTLTVLETEMKNSNGQLRFALNQTEKRLHEDFYDQMVPIIYDPTEPDAKVFKNTFDTVDELAARTQKVYVQGHDVYFKDSDEDVEWTRRNCDNELLITSEQINNVIIEDNKYKIRALKNFIMALLLLMTFIGLVLILLFASQQLDFIKTRNQFIGNFFQLDEYKIHQALIQVKRFEASLVKNVNEGIKFERKGTSKITVKGFIGNNHTSSRLSRKIGNKIGLNRRQIVALCLAFLFVMIVILPFINCLILTNIMGNDLIEKTNIVIEMQQSLYEILVLFKITYTYVYNKGIGLFRTRDIGEEWEAIYHQRSNSQGFLLKIMNDYEEEFPILRQLIVGDLCKMYSAVHKPVLVAACPHLGNGMNTKGMQSIISYVLYMMRNLKDDFDSSLMTGDDVKQALQRKDLIDFEISCKQLLNRGFDSLRNIFMERIAQVIKNINDSLTFVLAINIPVSTLCSILISYFLKKNFEDDRVEWRKMFRQIPSEMMPNNKSLQGILKKEDGNEYMLR